MKKSIKCVSLLLVASSVLVGCNTKKKWKQFDDAHLPDTYEAVYQYVNTRTEFGYSNFITVYKSRGTFQGKTQDFIYYKHEEKERKQMEIEPYDYYYTVVSYDEYVMVWNKNNLEYDGYFFNQEEEKWEPVKTVEYHDMINNSALLAKYLEIDYVDERRDNKKDTIGFWTNTYSMQYGYSFLTVTKNEYHICLEAYGYNAGGRLDFEFSVFRYSSTKTKFEHSELLFK